MRSKRDTLKLLTWLKDEAYTLMAEAKALNDLSTSRQEANRRLLLRTARLLEEGTRAGKPALRPASQEELARRVQIAAELDFIAGVAPCVSSATDFFAALDQIRCRARRTLHRQEVEPYRAGFERRFELCRMAAKVVLPVNDAQRGRARAQSTSAEDSKPLFSATVIEAPLPKEPELKVNALWRVRMHLRCEKLKRFLWHLGRSEARIALVKFDRPCAQRDRLIVRSYVFKGLASELEGAKRFADVRRALARVAQAPKRDSLISKNCRLEALWHSFCEELGPALRQYICGKGISPVLRASRLRVKSLWELMNEQRSLSRQTGEVAHR